MAFKFKTFAAVGALIGSLALVGITGLARRYHSITLGFFGLEHAMLRIIDTETCGLQGGIVEIASVDVIDGKIVNPMSHLVRPIKLFQRCNLPTNNLRIVDPHRAAKFSGQTQQIFGGEIGIGAEQ